MKCMYHSDNDGRAAGFWVNHIAKHYDGYIKEFIPINYGMKFPMEDIKPNEQVYIVDYSIQPDEMRELLKITNDVTWIDHHVTAIEKYKDFEIPIRGIRYNGIAGCMLTYCYLRHMTNNGEGEITPFEHWMVNHAPLFTKLIADYDVWTFEYGDNTRKFYMGFELHDKEPEDSIWDEMYRDTYIVHKIIKDGELLIRYRDKDAESYCKSYGYELEFEGYKCFVMNRGMCGSDHFKSVDDGTYDMFIGYAYDGKLYRYSLRSASIDVSEIAKKYGGGGHKGAAGFESKDFLLSEKSCNHKWKLIYIDMDGYHYKCELCGEIRTEEEFLR